MSSKLAELSDLGVSIWLDDLSRSRITSGNLQELIDQHNVVGVTTNPSIFQASISGSEDYADDIAWFSNEGQDVEEVAQSVMVKDVQLACDLMAFTYSASGGFDGRVSIEVDPRLARKGDQTQIAAEQLWKEVDRPNAMIKIPATLEGLSAIKHTIAKGISVNATLIFSEERYRAVADAYLAGLEIALDAGLDISQIHSVASVFVSRVDTEVDKRLETLGGPDALALRGKAGLANARMTYAAYIELFEESDRFARLREAGANVQRPLWASTGVKNPDYPATMYVDQLVSSSVVNTMPEKTLWATRESAELSGDTIREKIDEARRELDQVVRLGVDWKDVVFQLEREGVEKFEIAWHELLESVRLAMQ